MPRHAWSRFRQAVQKSFHHHIATFSKATVTSLAATVVDFGSLYVMYRFIGIYYVTATALAALFGAITNFALNRIWAFKDTTRTVTSQGFRYALVSAVSLGLNTLLVFLFTEFVHFPVLVSKVIASLSVGWGWNYPLHRFFVFSGSLRK